MELLRLRREHGCRRESGRSERRGTTWTSCARCGRRLIEARRPAPRVDRSTRCARVVCCSVISRNRRDALRRRMRSDEVVTCGGSYGAAHARWQGSDTDVVDGGQRIVTRFESKSTRGDCASRRRRRRCEERSSGVATARRAGVSETAALRTLTRTYCTRSYEATLRRREGLSFRSVHAGV